MAWVACIRRHNRIGERRNRTEGVVMDKFEYTIVSRKRGQTGTGVLLKELNDMGEQGWEAVCVLETSPLGYEYILMKRKK